MKALEKIREVIKILRDHGIIYPEKEAQKILCHALSIDTVKLYCLNPELSEKANEIIDNFVSRRIKREPIQYILGECDFYNLKIKVGRGVLIPRPETEILVDEVIKLIGISKEKNSRLLDLCTGSGCIALAVAKNLPHLKVFGVDISEKAIYYANLNKHHNKISNSYFVVGDLFSPFKKNSFAYITSNPPYVKTSEIQRLQPEIRDYEPKDALNGGESGLEYYEKILYKAHDYLLNEGFVVFELGIDQAPIVRKMAEKRGFEVIKAANDLAGIERVVILKRS